MLQLIIAVTKVLRQFKRAGLFILNLQPNITYFSKSSEVLINDSPMILRWHIKNAWRVEIEGLGFVSNKDCRIFNNIHSRSSLTIIAYGAKNTVSKRLDLNYREADLKNVFPIQFCEIPFNYDGQMIFPLDTMKKDLLDEKMGNAILFMQDDFFVKKKLDGIIVPITICPDLSVIQLKVASLNSNQQSYIDRYS
ncbi:MAG TPA: hypothetical protein VK498_06305 [Ferruginibacter sp.]|nr:hypothetical protein [Ferruginibacter sp.]